MSAKSDFNYIATSDNNSTTNNSNVNDNSSHVVLPKYQRLSSFLAENSKSVDENSGDNGRCGIALGKFEALHKGHQQLARRLMYSIQDNNNFKNEENRKLNGAFLVRLRGVSAALRKDKKKNDEDGDNDEDGTTSISDLPLVAPVDRARVLHEWSSAAKDNNNIQTNNDANSDDSGTPFLIYECSLHFSSVRFLSPNCFVGTVLNEQLGCGNVIVGPDFRFGYKAAGDVKVWCHRS